MTQEQMHCTVHHHSRSGETVIGLETIKLASGREVASVGLGLWKIDLADTAGVVAVCDRLWLPAFRQRLRLRKRNSKPAKDWRRRSPAAVSAAKILWITSKLWNTYHRREHVRPALEKSLSDLQLDYLDLYLVHFPIASKYVPIDVRYPPGWFTDPDAAEPRVEADRVPIIETWRAMEELVRDGLGA